MKALSLDPAQIEATLQSLVKGSEDFSPRAWQKAPWPLSSPALWAETFSVVAPLSDGGVYSVSSTADTQLDVKSCLFPDPNNQDAKDIF